MDGKGRKLPPVLLWKMVGRKNATGRALISLSCSANLIDTKGPARSAAPSPGPASDSNGGQPSPHLRTVSSTLRLPQGRSQSWDHLGQGPEEGRQIPRPHEGSGFGEEGRLPRCKKRGHFSVTLLWDSAPP